MNTKLILSSLICGLCFTVAAQANAKTTQDPQTQKYQHVCKGKKLTNMRASGSDDNVKLSPPRAFTLEQALEYIEDDELLEVTPTFIRMRKKELKANLRKPKKKD